MDARSQAKDKAKGWMIGGAFIVAMGLFLLFGFAMSAASLYVYAGVPISILGAAMLVWGFVSRLRLGPEPVTPSAARAPTAAANTSSRPPPIRGIDTATDAPIPGPTAEVGPGAAGRVRRCCICAKDLTASPAMVDKVTNIVFCEQHASLQSELLNVSEFTSCPHCGFRYSKRLATFPTERGSRCPSCQEDLTETDVAETRLSPMLRAVEEWMDRSPAGDASHVVEVLDRIGDPDRRHYGGWGIDWGAGKKSDILEILKKCFATDFAGGRTNIAFKGDVEGDRLGDFPVAPTHESRKNIGQSLLGIDAGLTIHYLAKIDTDLFALLLHQGGIAEEFQGTNKAVVLDMAERAKAEWRAAQPDVAKLTTAGEIAELIQALGHEDYTISRGAADSLVRLGAQAVEPLIGALDDPNREIRLRTVLALRKLGDRRAVDRLIDAIHDDDDTVRRQAVTTLGELGDERAVEPLIECLRAADADGILAGHAAEALGKLRDPRAENALIEAFQSDHSYPRKRAGVALGKFGSTRARDVLEAAFGQPDRFAATIGLAHMGNSEAMERLREAVSGGPDDQGEAAIALAELRDPATFDLVTKALRTADYSRSGDLIEALVELGDARAVDPLIELAKRESYRTLDVITALEKLGGDAAIDWLVGKIGSDYGYDAVKALSTIGDARAAAPLKDVVERSDVDSAIKQRALEGLERIGSR